MAEIASLCRDRRWKLANWDVDRGLSLGRTDDESGMQADSDPLAAVRSAATLATEDRYGVLVLKNFHRLLGGLEVVQALSHQLEDGKRAGAFVIVLAPVVQIPVELEKQFVVIEHRLPDREQLREIAESLAEGPEELPTPERMETLLDASVGLTRLQAEGAFGMSLVRHGRIDPETVWDVKSQELKKSGLLRLHRGSESFADLGGLDALKSFCQRALRRDPRRHPEAKPKGVLLLSPPGCGKSQLAKALGNETGRPTLALDVGTLMGSLVGQTEQRTRQALQIVDAMSPAVLWIDEIEKALSGVQSSGQADSGVSARMFGSLLTWLNDRTSDCFVVATCNDVSKLPPEFTRAERFDGIFYLELPGPEERSKIWSIYLDKFGLDPDQPRPRDEHWTGAEIKSCCRLASLLGIALRQAADNVVPVYQTANEAVLRLQQWASGRCLSANRPGVYRRESSARSSRQTPPDPLLN